jgi:hypothetical protein
MNLCRFLIYLPLVINMGCISEIIIAHAPYRAWQGVAADDDYVYVFTDRNATFGLENIISVYDHDGVFVSEVRNAYTGTDGGGHFMSFGDGNVISDMLFITAYNVNGGGAPPYQSRVLVYSSPELELTQEWNIGSGIAESVTWHNGSFWTTYHDQMVIRQFDTEFTFVDEYDLSELPGPYGGYQGAYWADDDLLIQMHGPNGPGLEPPAKGLDRYHWNGTEFEFVRTEEPRSYGTGQGVALWNDYVFQNDRPANMIIISSSN